MIVDLLATLASIAYSCYAWPTVLLDIGRWLRPDRKFPLLTRIRVEVKPFRYVALLGCWAPTILSGRLSWFDDLMIGVGLWFCYVTRHDKDDDDRWKRRKEKLSARVAVHGGRLQVVPVGGGGPP